MLAAEKKALGFYITAHPLDDYSETISKLGASSSIELPALETGGRARVAGLIKDLDSEEFEVREKATEELGKLGL